MYLWLENRVFVKSKLAQSKSKPQIPKSQIKKEKENSASGLSPHPIKVFQVCSDGQQEEEQAVVQHVQIDHYQRHFYRV